MPTCIVCLNKRDNIPVGGTCSNCNTPPKTDWFQYRNVKPLQPKRIMCISCGKDSGFNEKTVGNACWGKYEGGQQCWKCHQNYKSGVSSLNVCCGGRAW